MELIGELISEGLNIIHNKKRTVLMDETVTHLASAWVCAFRSLGQKLQFFRSFVDVPQPDVGLKLAKHDIPCLFSLAHPVLYLNLTMDSCHIHDIQQAS